MDVILLNGGITEASLIQRYIGPYKIAHWCRKHGYDTQVLDFVEICNEKMLYNMIKKFITPKTLVIGVSTTFMSVNTFMWSSGDKHLMPEAIYKALKKIKEEYNGIKIILGGYMSEKFPGYNLFDATIMSYYEATEEIFVEYLNHLRTGSEPPLGQIQFPLFKSKPRMVYFSARNKIYNIENDDFRFTKNDYILPGEPLPLDISRGCIFACRFCQFPHIGKKKLDYIRGMEYIESELLHNYENFGTTSYYVLDDTFNDTEQKLSEFNKMVQRLPFKLTYSAYIRADLVHRFPNTVHLLRESGLTGAYHGIESFHPESSKLVGKGWSGKEGKEFLPKLYHDLWGKNVAMHCNFIIGLTGESKDSIKSTIKWFLKNDMPASRFSPLGLFGPDPSARRTIQSEFDRNADKYGFKITSDPGDNGRVEWENDLWNSKMAMSWSDRVNKNLQPYQKYAAWGMQGLRWYGFTPQMLANHYIRQLPNPLIKRRSADLKRIYAEYVLTDKVDLSAATNTLVNIDFDFLNLVRSSRSF